MPYRRKETQRAYNAEWMRLRRAGESGTPGGTDLPTAFRIRAAKDVLELLEEAIHNVREASEAGPLERARTIGYLAGISLKAIEVADLSGRVESLEMILKDRKK